MLALGIGVNVAVFSFFNLLVLDPLDVPEPATLVRFTRHAPDRYAYAVPYPEMAYLAAHARVLSSVLAVTTERVSIDDGAQPAAAQFVTPNYFSELGAQAALGRLLDRDRDEGPAAWWPPRLPPAACC